MTIGLLNTLPPLNLNTDITVKWSVRLSYTILYGSNSSMCGTFTPFWKIRDRQQSAVGCTVRWIHSGRKGWYLWCSWVAGFLLWLQNWMIIGLSNLDNPPESWLVTLLHHSKSAFDCAKTAQFHRTFRGESGVKLNLPAPRSTEL